MQALVLGFYSSGYDFVIPSSRLHLAMQTLGIAMGFVGNYAPCGLSPQTDGMFLAVVIPAAKENRAVSMVVLASMAGSLAFTYLPLLRNISGGTRIIILTVVIAAAAAIIKPVEETEVRP